MFDDFDQIDGIEPAALERQERVEINTPDAEFRGA